MLKNVQNTDNTQYFLFLCDRVCPKAVTALSWAPLAEKQCFFLPTSACHPTEGLVLFKLFLGGMQGSRGNVTKSLQIVFFLEKKICRLL